MKKIFLACAFAAATSSAFGASMSISCTPVVGMNTTTVSSSLFFTQGSGSGSFSCSDASLGAVTLTAVSVSIFTDYTAGNGGAADPNDNSAGFDFTNTATTWGVAHPGALTSTMSLSTTPGVSLFTIGNLSSAATTFTNTTSGGLMGTPYTLPTTEAITGALLGSFSINASAFVDAGGFTSGASDARIIATYVYTTSTTPEPASMFLLGSGLVGLSLVGRKKIARK